MQLHTLQSADASEVTRLTKEVTKLETELTKQKAEYATLSAGDST
jgi:hypothetical protein